VRNLETTIEPPTPVVGEVVTVPVLEVVVVEQVLTGVHQSQQLPDGEEVRPSYHLHDLLLTYENKVPQLL
jgi:hypothetical protein